MIQLTLALVSPEEAHRRVALNWVRILAVAASLTTGMRALLLPLQ
jgi:hypothetical protein